ncbi:MAG TPA: non-homologous end-joining DNA ligase [Desulfomonilaceae bacterium]|nr:non-homologous end-joining DNA ligase [Desulfomonilaceae bacterium]
MSSTAMRQKAGEANYVPVLGKTLKFTHLDKVLYPEVGFTKAQVIDYYASIEKVILPHLKNRPLTVKRYPDGVDNEFFYEKQCPSYRPQWLETTSVPFERKRVNFCIINDLASLLWITNLASLEMHPSLSLSDNVSQPTMMVFDLDPGDPATLLECLDVALKLRELFHELGLESFPKSSGGKGLHVYVPLNTDVTYEKTKAFAHALAQFLEKRYPLLVTSNMRKDSRTGKVFMDWSQNDYHKTTVCVYSMRARSRPTVSAPLEWKECERALKRKDASKLVFESRDMLKRIQRKGDIFAPVLSLHQKLPDLNEQRTM